MRKSPPLWVLRAFVIVTVLDNLDSAKRFWRGDISRATRAD